MKKFFISVLLVGLFVSVQSAWAQSDTKKKDKTPAKIETTVKKADAPKGTAACCPDMKDGCPFKSGEAKACCPEKKAESKAAAACCPSKATADKTKSSGKKAN